MCFWCDQIILDLSVAGCKSPKSRQKMAGNAERQRSVSLSHKEKVHSQFLRVRNVLFFFCGSMSLCQVEQRKRPQLRAATSVAVIALCLRVPLDLLGFFSRETQSAWKRLYCKLQLLCIGCCHCLCVKGSLWLLLGHRQPLRWQLGAGSLTLEVKASLQGSGCTSLTWTRGSRSFPGRHRRQLFSGRCLWTTHLDTSPSPDTSPLSEVQVRRPSGACRRTEPDIWGQRRQKKMKYKHGLLRNLWLKTKMTTSLPICYVK